jgi:cytochrome P450
MVFRDGPDHVRARRSLSGMFRPRSIEAMRGRIQALADGIVDSAGKRGSMEVVSQLAYPLPMMVISDLLGLPHEDGDRFRRWSNQLTAALDRGDAADMERAAPAVAEMQEYFRALAARHRNDPGGQSLPVGGEPGVSEEEVLATTVFLMWAGHETTKNLIASGLLTLLRNPGQMERLRQTPGLIGAAVEECLRYESPLQKIGRWSRESIRVGDRTIPADTYVVALIGAANRDPARFADPERFDIERPDGGHIACGAGAHFCLGAQLARLEAQVALSTVLRKLPRLALTAGEPAWRRYTAFRSLESLSVVC